MYVVTGEEMNRIDEAAVERYGIPSIILMENAGLKVTQSILDIEQHIKKVIVVAGKGNNGGDGLVVARQLFNRGYDVKVFLLGQGEDLKGDSQINFNILKKLDVPIISINTEKDLNMLRIALVYSHLIVDAIFGTGFKGAALGLSEKVIQLMNKSGLKIMSVDIPSGLEAATGKVHGICVKADQTITFAYPKVGLFMNQASQYVGELIVVDISIPDNLAREEGITRYIIQEEEVKKLLPQRYHNSYKNTYGHTLTVAGAPGMTGAAYLTAQGALTIGAGLVTLGIPKSLNNVLEQKLSEVMTKALPETGEGSLSKLACEPLLELTKKMSVLIIGPGLSQHQETKELVIGLLNNIQLPVVIDADAINALADNPEVLKNLKVEAVITPHPGELSRLMGMPVAKIQQNRLGVASECAKKFGVTVVLKGDKTIIANSKGQCWINLTGNSGLATAGTGDVLAGFIGGLISQGLSVDQASILGVYLHGKTADQIIQDKSKLSLIASDLLLYLPHVIKDLEAN